MWRHLMTSKHFRYGLLFTSIGALGLAIFGVFRIYAFSYLGPLTLPYTTPIDDISAILFFGSLPVSESIALYQWLRNDIKAETEEKEEPQIIPAQEAAPVVATLAQATITPVAVAAPVAIPAATDLVFIDETGILKLGETSIELPALKNEHLLCRVMFKQPINKMVDWSAVYEEMSGEELNKVSFPDEYWKAWHSLYSTTKALNTRVNERLGIERLVKWKDNTLQRMR
jgi:hypothetical protein